jgi:hypothetical protein
VPSTRDRTKQTPRRKLVKESKMKLLIKLFSILIISSIILKQSFAYTAEEVLNKWENSAKFTHYGYKLSVEQLYKITPLDQKNSYQYNQKWDLYYNKNNFKWDITSNNQNNKLNFLNNKWRYLNDMPQMNGKPYKFGTDSNKGYPETNKGILDKVTLPQMLYGNSRAWPITARQILLAPMRPYGELNLAGELDKNLPEIYAEFAKKHPEGFHITAEGDTIILEIADLYREYKGSILPNLIELKQHDNVLVPEKIQVISYMDKDKKIVIKENMTFFDVQKVKDSYLPFKWERKVLVTTADGKSVEIHNLNGKINKVSLEDASEREMAIEFTPDTITDETVGQGQREETEAAAKKRGVYAGLTFTFTFIALMLHFIQKRRPLQNK